MSQQSSSQTSNCSLEPILSQETFDQVFSSVHGIFDSQQDFNRIQTECQMAPTIIQLTDENIHENVEMTLNCVGVMRPEVEFPPFMPDHSFRIDLKQEPTCSTSFKREPVDNSRFISSTMTTPPPEQPIPQPLIVCNTDFPGTYGFDLGFEEEKGPVTKSVHWTYSPALKKLFVKMRCIVPLRFRLQVFPPAPGFYVRVVVIYRQPDHYREIVERCPNHITKHKDGHHAPKHLLRCENPRTDYVTCPETGRHSLKIPLEAPQAGSDFVTNMFQFMCFSSCPGGLNRRPILVVFTLEYNNMVLGRKAQDIRICACPGRDRGIEENAEAKRQSNQPAATAANPQTPNVTPPPTPQISSTPRTPPPEEPTTSTGAEETNHVQVPKLTKKRCKCGVPCTFPKAHSIMSSGFEVRSLSANRMKRMKTHEDEEIFTIQVKGRDKYEMLLKIKEGLDIMDMVPQAQIDNYRASCPPCGRLTSSRSSQRENSQNVNSQNSDSQISTDSQPDELDGTPPISQLSRSDSGSSYQSPTSSQQSSGGGTGINAVRFTLRRTVSLDKKGFQQ
ncbi:cellular tumor antigen p53-like isoform X2 [Oculina patagonica]